MTVITETCCCGAAFSVTASSDIAADYRYRCFLKAHEACRERGPVYVPTTFERAPFEIDSDEAIASDLPADPGATK